MDINNKVSVISSFINDLLKTIVTTFLQINQINKSGVQNELSKLTWSLLC